MARSVMDSGIDRIFMLMDIFEGDVGVLTDDCWWRNETGPDSGWKGGSKNVGHRSSLNILVTVAPDWLAGMHIDGRDR
jgi:hypothetical protein